jgi:hypothetical protein
VQGISHPPCFAAANNDPPELFVEKCPPCFCCVILSPNPPNSSLDASPSSTMACCHGRTKRRLAPRTGRQRQWSNRDGRKGWRGRKGRRRAELGERGFPPGEGFPQGSREQCSTGAVARGWGANTRMVRPHRMDAGRMARPWKPIAFFLVPLDAAEELGAPRRGERWCRKRVPPRRSVE